MELIKKDQEKEMGMDKCKHPTLTPPEFDLEASKALSSAEVKARWPRKTEHCPDCNQTVIMYASWEHYIAGDW